MSNNSTHKGIWWSNDDIPGLHLGEELFFNWVFLLVLVLLLVRHCYSLIIAIAQVIWGVLFWSGRGIWAVLCCLGRGVLLCAKKIVAGILWLYHKIIPAWQWTISAMLFVVLWTLTGVYHPLWTTTDENILQLLPWTGNTTILALQTIVFLIFTWLHIHENWKTGNWTKAKTRDQVKRMCGDISFDAIFFLSDWTSVGFSLVALTNDYHCKGNRVGFAMSLFCALWSTFCACQDPIVDALLGLQRSLKQRLKRD